MKVIKYIILLLQASVVSACFTSSARKRMHKRWEATCEKGIQFHGRHAASHRFMSCVLFSLTESWGRKKRSTADAEILDDIVLVANETIINEMLTLSSVAATLQVDVLNSTYVVTIERVWETQQNVNSDKLRFKRDVTGLQIKVQLPSPEESEEFDSVYFGETQYVNGSASVVFRTKRAQKKKPKPKPPTKRPWKTTTTTRKATTTKQKATSPTSKVTTTQMTTTTTTQKTTTTMTTTTTTEKATTKLITTQIPVEDVQEPPVAIPETKTKANYTNASTKSSSENKVVKNGNEAKTASNENNENKGDGLDAAGAPKSSYRLGNDSQTGIRNSSEALQQRMNNTFSADKQQNATATAFNGNNEWKQKPEKQKFNVPRSDRKITNNVQHSSNPESKPKGLPDVSSNKWIFSLLAVPGLGVPAGIGFLIWRNPSILMFVLRCFACKKRGNSMEMRG